MNQGISSQKYGEYRVERLVGSDGYRTIYKAYDEALDRPAALKVFSSTVSEHKEFVQQFKKNMQSLAQLNHPRIPLIYSFGMEGRDYYVAMEWCEGGSLANLLRKQGRLPLRQAIQILLQCIQGLSVAWKLGIAHGNLRPNNLIFAEEQEIKIIDFGLIPAELEAQSFSGAVSFMAPERGSSAAADIRMDIYSLGIVLYYMMLNSIPAEETTGDSAVGMASPGILPPEVLKLIDRMTRDDPAERYDSYDTLSSDMEDLLARIIAEEPSLTVPKARDVQPNATIKTGNLFDLLAQVFRAKADGVLRMNWFALSKEFLVRQGEIVFFHSTQPDENIGLRFAARKWLSAEESRRHSEDPEQLIQQTLLGRRCTVDQIAEVYRDLMREALWQVFLWPTFEGAFFAGRILNDPFVTLRISDLLLEASRSVVEIGAIRSALKDDFIIKRTPQFEALLAPFALNAEESFLAFRFEDEDMKLSTLGALTGLPEERILRVTYLLQKIGALDLRPVVARPAARPAPRPARPAPPPAPPAAAPPPPPRPIVEVVKSAETKPRAQEPPAPPPRKLTFEEALIPVEKPKTQQAPAPGPSPSPAPAPSAALSSARTAELCFQKAERAYEEKNYGMAAHHCREALQHHQDARYHHLLGAAYARHPRFQKDAEDAFHQAIALAPEDADYHSVLAAFYCQRKLWIRARTHCEKALALQSNHRQAVELLDKILEQKPGPGECWCVSGAKG